MSQMDSLDTSEIDRLAQMLEAGYSASPDTILPMVYDELRRIAQYKMNQEQPGQTLQATALVHEAYLRLQKSGTSGRWESKGHFFAAIANTMRRILVDRSREKSARKRGKRAPHVDLGSIELAEDLEDEGILILDEAIQALESKDSKAARLVQLRFFAGFTNVDAASALGISERSAKSLWAYARAWLRNKIEDIQNEA